MIKQSFKQKRILSIILLLSLFASFCSSSSAEGIEVGETIIFGHYEQDNDTSNGKEPIEWLVLEIIDGKALLISQYALDVKPYHIMERDVTWENCSLRSWCNENFLKEAFSPDEQGAIQLSTVDNSKAQGYPWSQASGGKDTFDRIFLLSYKEAEKYFDRGIDFESQRARICKPTSYAAYQGNYEDWEWYHNYDDACSWWLRSPGWPDYANVSNNSYAATVTVAGKIGYTDVGNNEWVKTAVRPALRIDLSCLVWEKPASDVAKAERVDAAFAPAAGTIGVGDTVYFGLYEQNKDDSDGKEPIEWQVLDAKDDKILLISTDILEMIAYHSAWTDITWEYCTLRTWLNGEFLNEAFNTDERRIILTSEIDNSPSQGNGEWDSYSGKDTLDQIFLLSYEEAKKYYPDDITRRCQPTAYAAPEWSESTDGYIPWWLRSAGSSQFSAAIVDSDGSLEYSYEVFADTAGIRPALWIGLRVQEEQTGTDITQPDLPDEVRAEYTYDSEGRVSTITEYDSSGRKVRITRFYRGVIRDVSIYDEYEREIRRIHYGEDGKPGLASWGFTGWDAEYDGNGNRIRLTYFGLDFEPVIIEGGYCTKKSEYDKYGNEIRISYYGLNDEPVIISSGEASVETEYVRIGNEMKVSRVSYYGVDGELVLLKYANYAYCTYEYGESGKEIRRSYYGVHGEPALYYGMYTVEEEESYVAGDRLIVRLCYYGLEGEYAMGENDYAVAEWEYDSNGELFREQYYDENYQEIEDYDE